MSSTQENHLSIPTGLYRVPNGNLFLAVAGDKSIVLQQTPFTWNVAAHDFLCNSLKDPGSGLYLHDDSTGNVLSASENGNGLWAELSREK